MVPGDRRADDAGRADGGSAGPHCGQGPGRRARRLPAASAAAPDRDRHRPRRAGPDPVRAHPGHGVPVLCRAGPDPAGGAMPRRLAPRSGTGDQPRPGDGGATRTDRRPGRGAGGQRSAGQRGPRCWRTGRADRRAGRGDRRIRDAGQRASGAAAAASVDQAPPGRCSPSPPQGQPQDGRQDLYRGGRQDFPAVAVRHADLPFLRPGRRGRSTRRPGHLRLCARRPRRAALRRAVRPVHPEPAPVHRL